MNLVVAVKAEPKRQARVTKPQYVTLLLAASEEAADVSIVHRDGEYNSKLQGTCFTCSKLNANPPQSVCDVPDPDDPPQGCIPIDDDPCTCNNCPPPPPPRDCDCSSASGYPAPNTTGLGSGYWVGLQANTYYSIVPNGGWVVAVSCLNSQILGAFPVTGSNFGYGRGDIAGNPVMIYPAGAVNGAGYLPANETSFPILTLIPSEGNDLISEGFTDPIVSGSSLPLCPAQTPTAFCSASNSFVYEGFPKPCLGKFPRTQSDCPEYDNFKEWPENKPYDDEQNSYYINMSNVVGFNGQVTGSIAFSGTDGKSYCGTIEDWVQSPTDALTGPCGGTEWVDPPTAFYDNCIECTDENVKVPCQYLLNLTNGEFSGEYGGYNSAAQTGKTFFGIGPAFPPNTGDNGSTSTGGSGRYWNTFWNWEASPQGEFGTADPYLFNGNVAFIPPIGNLQDKCKCPNNEARNSSIIFVEQFECCQDGFSAGKPVAVTAYKPFTPGFSGCGATCNSSCPHPKCSCNGTNPDSLGRPSVYGYIPCSNCTPPLLNNQEPVSGIWWAQYTSTGLSAINAANKVVAGSADAPGPDNSCKNVFESLGSPTCACGNLFDTNPDITDPNDPNYWVLNPDKLENCVGFRDPDEFINDPCSRANYLPASMKDCNLEYSPTPITPDIGVPTYANNFANHIIVRGDCGPCSDGQSLMDCMCSDPFSADCFLRNIGGPFAPPYNPDDNFRECNVFVSAQFGCSIPVMESQQVNGCNGLEDADKLTFKPINNDKCEQPDGWNTEQNGPFLEAITDPCGCCDQSIDPNGGGDGIPSVGCSSGNPSGPCQADCCQGSGCATGECEINPSFINGTC